MADENNTPQQDQLKLGSEMFESVQEPETTLLPSTTQNQQVTEEARAQAQAKQNVFNPERIENLKRNGLDEAEAQKVILEEEFRKERMQQEREEQERIEAQQQAQMQKQDLDSQIQSYETTLQFAEGKGLATEAMKSKLEQLKQQRETLTPITSTAQAESEVDEAVINPTPENIENALNPAEAEIEQKAKDLRTNIATEVAVEKEAQKQAVQDADDQAETVRQVEDKKSSLEQELQAVKDKDFWGSQDTMSQIGLALSVVLGGIGQGLMGRGPNQALNILNKRINDFAARKAKETNRFQEEIKYQAYGKLKDDLNLKLLRARTEKEQQAIKALKAQTEQAQAAEAQQMLLRTQASKGDEKALVRLLSKEQLSQANKLRGEYNQQIKDLGINEIISQAKQAVAISKNPSAAGDIALIFSYMKILDPKSVVRGSEYEVAANAAPKVQALQRFITKLATGEIVTPSQRRDFVRQAKTAVKAKLEQAQEVSDRYENLSQNFGIPPKAAVGVEKYTMDRIFPEDGAIKELAKLTGKSEQKVQQSLRRQGVSATQVLQAQRGKRGN